MNIEKSGIIHFDMTLLFQILNTLLLVLVIYVLFKLIKNYFSKKKKLEARLEECEKEIQSLKNQKY